MALTEGPRHSTPDRRFTGISARVAALVMAIADLVSGCVLEIDVDETRETRQVDLCNDPNRIKDPPPKISIAGVEAAPDNWVTVTVNVPKPVDEYEKKCRFPVILEASITSCQNPRQSSQPCTERALGQSLSVSTNNAGGAVTLDGYDDGAVRRSATVRVTDAAKQKDEVKRNFPQ